MNRNEKSLFALGALLLIIVGVMVYYIITNSAQTPTNQNPGTDSGGGTLPDTSRDVTTPWDGDGTGGVLPSTSETVKNRLAQLTKEPTIGSSISKNGERVMYFNRGTGHLFQIPFDGQGGEERLSSNTIKNIIKAAWSWNKDYALLATQNDFDVKNWWLQVVGTTTLSGAFPGPSTDFSFSPSENRVAVVKNTDLGPTLLVSDPRGTTGLKPILELPLPDIQPQWIEKNTIALQTKASFAAPSLIQLTTPSGTAPSFLQGSKNGLTTLWDTRGARYVVGESIANGKDVSLSLYNRTRPGEFTTLTFKTLPEKCVFSASSTNSTIYCAIPRSLGGLSLPDSWWQGRTQFSDELWAINLTTGETSLVLGEGTDFDMTNLILSPKEDFIFFINKKDSTLWSYRLVPQEIISR